MLLQNDNFFPMKAAIINLVVHEYSNGNIFLIINAITGKFLIHECGYGKFYLFLKVANEN
jgi:hypothetical protein